MPKQESFAVPTWCFALTVVQKHDRFLLVQEVRHDQRWYLPAGRLEPGETFAEAALRETLEESGVPITLTGVISIEMSYRNANRRIRTVFTGTPLDDTPVKSAPDEHTLRAAWVHPDELGEFQLRAPDVVPLIQYVVQGGLVHPLSVLATEGDILIRGRSG